MPEFACQDCDAHFNSFYDLQRHESRHAGDKPIRRDGYGPGVPPT